MKLPFVYLKVETEEGTDFWSVRDDKEDKFALSCHTEDGSIHTRILTMAETDSLIYKIIDLGGVSQTTDQFLAWSAEIFMKIAIGS